jgi:hypothetical protein
VKKLLLLLFAAAAFWALGLLPFRSTDAAKLLPVKTVIVTRSGDRYVVDIGAGVRAVGRTLSEALERLKEEITGEIFLPTAEQVIITEPAGETPEAEAETVAAVAEETAFRPAAGIYRTPADVPDPEALGEYLASHSSNYTILDARAAIAAGEEPTLPRIVPADGGWRVEAQTEPSEAQSDSADAKPGPAEELPGSRDA